MASGVVIRLKNLPLAAGTIDIRRFFNGLRIPDGGVHIIGGDDGTTFILFSTDEDARQAMLQDGQVLCGSVIKLMLSSHTEMKTVIEQSQRICEQLRGQRPPDPPITNLSSRSTASNYQKPQERPQTKPTNQEVPAESLDANDVYIEIKGMPFSVNQTDIVYFFSSLSVSAIKFMLDDKQRKNGSGYIKFSSPKDKQLGLKRDRNFIGSRFVKLASATERQWLLANSHYETIRLASENAINRKRQQSVTSTDEALPKRSRELSPLKSDNCVEVRGLPATSTFKDVGDFFSRLKFAEGGLYVEMNGSVCKGIAYVEFVSYADFKQALDKDGDMVNGHQVRVISLSKQNMLEQISKHKKQIKAKREEQEKKLRDKKSKEVDFHKKKDQSRKQKDMNEWLRRQHIKEESERKRLGQEKPSVEESKQLGQLLLDAKAIENLKLTEDSKLNEELKAKILELAEQANSIADNVKVEKAEEPLPGAEEMDIVDDANEEPNVQTTTIQQHIAVPSTTLGLTMLGNSGSVVAPQVPVGFNPLINPPFSLAGLSTIRPPPLPGTLPFSSAGLVPVLPSVPFMPSPSAPVNVPHVPPGVVLPPPTPGVGLPINTFSETMVTTTLASSVVSPVVNNLQGTLVGHFPETVNSEYARVANAPYYATEEHVRHFFSGLNIPEKGIQFINKADGRRSGQIFIKFASKEDAAKAALKDDSKFLGRSVLVKTATMKVLSVIYQKLTKGKEYVPTFGSSKASSSVEDDAIAKQILVDQMTCVCIGNIPPTATEEDIVKLLDGIKFLKNKILIVKNSDGKCRGDVYVEFESSFECIKAANLHDKAKIGEQIIRVLPLTFEAMIKEFNSKQHQSAGTQVAKSNGHNYKTVVASETLVQPFDLTGYQGPPQKFENITKTGAPPIPSNFMRSQFDPLPRSFPDVPPPRHPFPDLPMTLPPLGAPDVLLPPTPEELVRMQMDPVFGLPPHAPPPLPSTLFMNRPPLPINSPVATVKMSNLAFRVTREDIMEFFARYDPLPDSIKLMYNNQGKPTGDGIVSFPNFEAAKAAVEKLNFRRFLARKIRLTLH